MAQLIKGVVDTQIENLIPIGSTNAGDDTVIELSIKSNGQDFIFNNPTFELLSKKEDNTKTRQIKDITLLDGKVKIKADIQLTLCKGIVTNQLIINDGDKISTVYFYFMVNPSLENEVLEESKDKIESLDKLDKLINTSFSDLEAYENKLLAFSAEMDSIVEVESKREANELIRSTSEVKRISNEDSRIISEEDRIANEAIRVENEEARGLAESERVTNENNRRLAENTRKTQENARVAAEEQRQSIFEENENIRKEQEDNRVQAERIRKNKFDIWEEREGIRLISEDQRRESEEARQVSESNRDKAEKVREQQEANRQLTYNRFNSEEEERVNNENSRKDKENLRVLAENSRVAAEEERVAAENTRNSRYETAESNRNNTFNSNENKRQSDYESNEGTRNSTFEAEERKRKNSYQDAENTRNNSFNQQEENRQNEYTVAERLRVENENLRKNNEVTRGSNEETRKSNETSRVSSENIRVENENSRVAAEQKRQEDFKNIQSQYDNIVTENNNFKNEMNKDYGNAKVDYFGEEHLNVVNRLNSDFDNVHQRINDSSYLEYIGATIKADNSYFGLSKDLSIKGRTLQNLAPLKYLFNNLLTKSEVTMNSTVNIYDQVNNRIKEFVPTLPLKTNTKYTIIANVTELTGISNIGSMIKYSDNSESYSQFSMSNIGVNVKTFTTGNLNVSSLSFYIAQTEEEHIGKIKEVILLEGDYTNTPISEIPFGEGIYSVGEKENNLIKIKATNKNLFRYEYVKPRNSLSKVIYDENSVTITDEYYCGAVIKVKRNTRYFVSAIRELLQGTKGGAISIFESDGKSVQGQKPIATLGNKNGWFDSGNNNYISFLLYGGSAEVGTCKFSNVQIEEIGKSEINGTEYNTPKINFQSFQLNDSLKSLPNGVCDLLYGNEYIKKIMKLVINQSIDFYEYADINYLYDNCYCFRCKLPNSINSMNVNNLMCDSFIPIKAGYSKDVESVSRYGKTLYIRVKISKLPTDGTKVERFKKWLANNPFTIYYELAEPIITPIEPLVLNSFDGTTHIEFENNLPGTITTKIASNVQAVIQDTRARNVELEKELEVTTVKLEEADNKLQEMDTDLVATTWNMDDRLYEIEWALEDSGLGTVNLMKNIINKKGVSVMALSKFEQAKIIIMSGDYDRVTLEGQLSKYLKRNIIAQDEYDTLISMMDAKEIVVGE